MHPATPTVPGKVGPYVLGLGLLALSGLLGCGGADPAATSTQSAPAPASGLTYTPPVSNGYRLVADPSSTPTQLVLNLVGPTGASVSGVILHAMCDQRKVAWAAPAGSTTLAKPGTALNLGTGLPLLESNAPGLILNVALFQKGNVVAATLGAQPVFSVALNLKPGTAQGPVALKMMPGCQVVDAAGNKSNIQVAAGTIIAN